MLRRLNEEHSSPFEGYTWGNSPPSSPIHLHAATSPRLCCPSLSLGKTEQWLATTRFDLPNQLDMPWFELASCVVTRSYLERRTLRRRENAGTNLLLVVRDAS